MQTSIATVSLSGTLTRSWRRSPPAGFEGVEIFENDCCPSTARPREVRRDGRRPRARRSHLPAVPRLRGHAGAARAPDFDRAERKFDLMQELGCDLLLVCSNVSPDALGGIDRAAADFRELGERAASAALRVGFEALAWGRHVNDYRDAWEIVRRADHPRDRRSILDTFHTLARGTDLNADPLDPRATASSSSSSPTRRCSTWIYLSWSRHYRCMPGQGDLAGRRLHAARCRPPATTGCCRSRSSTTGSAPARRAASRSTAIAR